MLEVVGAESLDALFEDIPEGLRLDALDLDSGLSEEDTLRVMGNLAAANHAGGADFLGGGIEHHLIPRVVDEVQGRSEFWTAYTPYQPEASQGTLAAFFEFQTMIARLCGMDVAQSSLYDGAGAVVEAVVFAVKVTDRSTVWLGGGLSPETRRVVATVTAHMDLTVRTWPLGPDGRSLAPGTDGAPTLDDSAACLVVASPNDLGVIEDLAPFAEAAHAAGAMAVAVAHPLTLGVLAPPGDCGFDVAVGDGQTLGVPPQFGGPGFGFFACREDQVRSMPGRIVGETIDGEGRRGFVLTFQTREQHIRREKATSNICTNNALMALRGAVHMAALGPEGLAETGRRMYTMGHETADRVFALDGYGPACSAPFFHEFLVRCPGGADGAQAVHDALTSAGVRVGAPLADRGAGFADCLRICATEATRVADIDTLVAGLEEAQA